MHLLLAAFIGILLFTEGYASSKEGFDAKENVPETAKNALLRAIKEQRTSLRLTNPIEYNYDLAKKAVRGEYGGSDLNIVDVQSVTFGNSLDETMRTAVRLQRNRMINAAETIGCQITLTTSTSDGSHNLKLYCLLGKENGEPLH